MFGMREDAWVVGGELDEVVKFARVKSTDIVACAGRHGSEIAVAFARCGQCAGAYFEKSSRQGRNRIADFLIVGDATSGDAIGTLLCSNMQILKSGGQLILRLQDLDDDCIVQLCLSALGYRVTSTVFDLSAGVLVAHRVDLDRKVFADDPPDIGEGAGILWPSRKAVLSFGRLYHSSAIVGSTAVPAPFIQTSWS
eukprot:gene22876-27914_t